MVTVIARLYKKDAVAPSATKVSMLGCPRKSDPYPPIKNLRPITATGSDKAICVSAQPSGFLSQSAKAGTGKPEKSICPIETYSIQRERMPQIISSVFVSAVRRREVGFRGSPCKEGVVLSLCEEEALVIFPCTEEDLVISPCEENGCSVSAKGVVCTLSPRKEEVSAKGVAGALSAEEIDRPSKEDAFSAEGRGCSGVSKLSMEKPAFSTARRKSEKEATV